MTSSSPSPIAESDRFSRLEDSGSDFPFYNGSPTSISGAQWLFVMAMGVVGFLVLVAPIKWPSGALWPFIPAIALPGIPLLALAIVAPGHWRAIFGKVGGREVTLMFGFALLNIVVSMSVGVVVYSLGQTSPNAAAAQLSVLDTAGRIAYFAKTIPQLFGEEVITILPFLALLHWFTNSLGLGRKAAIMGAWLVTAVVFGLIHLPTYDWNWIQCIVIIGSARLVLTLPWILTKNIWVSTGAHIVNDWLLFTVPLIGAGLVNKV